MGGRQHFGGRWGLRMGALFGVTLAIVAVGLFSAGPAGAVDTPAAHGQPTLQDAIVRIARSQAQSHAGIVDMPPHSGCNPYTGYWGDGSPCADGLRAGPWEADFAAWVWRQAGAQFTYGSTAADLNSSPASFYDWGTANGTWHPRSAGYVPQAGDVAVFGGLDGTGGSVNVGLYLSGPPSRPTVIFGDWVAPSARRGNDGVIRVMRAPEEKSVGRLDGYVSPIGEASPPPSVSGFDATPTLLYQAGGTISLTAQVTGAVLCQFSSVPELAGLPADLPCSEGEVQTSATAPPNAGTAPVTYALELRVTGTTTIRAGSLTVTVAPTPPPQTSVSSFQASPSTLGEEGGPVQLAATVANATSCTFSSTVPVSGLPVTEPCTTGRASVEVDLPSNPGNDPVSYTFAVAAVGSTSATAQTSVSVSSGYAFDQPAGIAFDGSHLWVTNQLGNSVTEFNADDGSWIRTLSGPQYGFDGPNGIVFDGTHLWVSNFGVDGVGSSVTELDADDGSLVQTLAGGSYGFRGPEAMAVDGTHLWVTNFQGNSVTELDLSDGSWVQTLAAGSYGLSGPSGIAFDGADLWVTNSAADSVTEISAADGSWIQTLSGGSFGFQIPSAIIFDGTDLWVANAFDPDGSGTTLTEIDPAHGSWIQTVPGSSSLGYPSGLVFDGTNLWETTTSNQTGPDQVTEVNASTGALEQNVILGPTQSEDPSAIAFDGTDLWVTNMRSNTVTELSDADGSVVQTLS